MQEALQGKMSEMQIQDFMQKQQEAKAQKQRQQLAQQITLQGYQPEQQQIFNTPSAVLRDEEGNMMPGANIRPEGFNLQSIAPKLMAIGPEGLQQLSALSTAQKAMLGEAFTLGEGQNRYRMTPTGAVLEAEGGRKPLALTGEVIYPYFINNPQVYPTTVGLYNDANELLAVAKLSRPLQKNFTKEALVRVKLDF